MDSSNRRKKINDSVKIGNSKYPSDSPSTIRAYNETSKKPPKFQQPACPETSRNEKENNISNVWVSLGRKPQVCLAAVEEIVFCCYYKILLVGLIFSLLII